MCQRKEKLLTKCHVSKKGKTAEKRSCLKFGQYVMHQILNFAKLYMCQRKEKLLTKCHVSKKGKTAEKRSCLKFGQYVMH